MDGTSRCKNFSKMKDSEIKVGYTDVFFKHSLGSFQVYKIEFSINNEKISFDPIHAAKFLSESLERYLIQKNS